MVVGVREKEAVGEIRDEAVCRVGVRNSDVVRLNEMYVF